MRREEYRVPRPAENAVQCLAPQQRHDLLADLMFAMPSKEFRRYGAKTVWCLGLWHAPREFANQRRRVCAIGLDPARAIWVVVTTAGAERGAFATLYRIPGGAPASRLLVDGGCVAEGEPSIAAARSSSVRGGPAAGTGVSTAPTPAASITPIAVRLRDQAGSAPAILVRRRTISCPGGGGGGSHVSVRAPVVTSGARRRPVARCGITPAPPAKTPTPPAW